MRARLTTDSYLILVFLRIIGLVFEMYEDCYAQVISDVTKVLCTYRKVLLKEEK